jgi:hypothetical protein
LKVVVQSAAGVDSVKTITTDYTVSGVGSSVGGAVVFVTAPVSGETVSIILDPELTQLTDYSTGGAFPAQSHEDALDKQLNINKRTRDLVDRSIHISDGDSSTPSLTVPSLTLRASKALTFDSSGNVTVTDPATASGTTVTATGTTTARALQERFAEAANIKDFGAVGDGVTDDTAALVAAEASSSNVFIPTSTSFYVFTQVPDITKCWGPGVCKVGGAVVYLRPTPEPATRIFLEVFQPADDGNYDSATELQAAIDFAQDKEMALEFPRNKIFRVDSTLVIKTGNVTLVDLQANGRNSLTIYGNESRISVNVNAAGVWVQPQMPLASYVAGVEWGRIEIYDLWIEGTLAVNSGYTSAIALRIGREGYTYSPPYRRDIYKNISVSGFTNAVMTLPSVKITNADRFIFDNLTVANDSGVLIESTDNNSNAFTGDSEFRGCWLTGGATRKPLHIIGNNTVGTSTGVEAIYFSQCQLLGGGSLINAGDNDWFRRIVFDSCHFADGLSNVRHMSVTTTGTGKVDRISFHNCDMGINSAAGYYFSGSGTGWFSNVSIHGGEVHNISDGGGDTSPIVVSGVDHLVIRDVSFKDISTTGPAMLIGASDSFSVHGCTGATAIAVNTDFIQITDDSTCDDWSIQGNSAELTGTGKMVDITANSGSGQGIVENNRIVGGTPALTSIASATSIALPAELSKHNAVITVTGSTAVENITGGTAGQFLTILWATSATFDVTDAATGAGEIHLGATITAHVATDTLTLVSDGTDWYEVSVSVN